MTEETIDATADGGEPSDRALVLRMRAGEERAFREFFLRFEPLLVHLARRARVQPALRREVVDDGLARIALHLARPTSVTPDRLAGYVAAAFLGPQKDATRSELRRERLTAEATVELGDAARQRAVAATCSQASLRASVGAYDHEAAPQSAAVTGLLDALQQRTTEDERRVLGWLAERVPQRLIAEWTGTSHDAMRKRILRLRARLRSAVLRHVAGLPPGERGAALRVLGHGVATRAAHDEDAVPIGREGA